MYDAPNMDNGFDVFLKKIVKEEPEIKLVIVDTFQLIRGEQFAGNAYAYIKNFYIYMAMIFAKLFLPKYLKIMVLQIPI